MEIFVIGATGYIGSAFSESLLKQGHKVTGLARSSESVAKLSKAGIEPIEGSFEDASNVLAAATKADIVIDAAYGYNDADVARQQLAAQTSHLTPILQAMHGSGKTFVQVSGSGVFWDSGEIVYEETTVLPATDDPVIQARQVLEQEVLRTAQSSVRSIVLRPPTVYGRGGSLMIPRFLLDYALKTGESFYIQGCENHKWSAVHIDDLCDLLLLALQKAPAGSLYSTAAESGITSLQIATSVSRAAGLDGKVTALGLDEVREIFGHWADWWSINNQCSGTKARTELGWQPVRPSILEDIERGSYVANLARFATT